jgi:hypothetical protein
MVGTRRSPLSAWREHPARCARQRHRKQDTLRQRLSHRDHLTLAFHVDMRRDARKSGDEPLNPSGLRPRLGGLNSQAEAPLDRLGSVVDANSTP